MNPLSSIAILIAAGGSSTRFGSGNKLLAQLDGEAVFTRCLRNLSGPGVQFVIATNNRDDLAAALPRDMVVTWAPGGTTRTASVASGLETLAQTGALPDYIAVHDAARPFATYELLRSCLATLEDTQADGVIAAHKVTDTIHQVSAQGLLTNTPQRDLLWAAETPQLFRSQLLLDAYRAWKDAPNPPAFSDDASLVHWTFPDARLLFQGHPGDNRKITFPRDL